MKEAIFTATEFKATCLEVLNRLASHDLERVTITKRGRAVAVLSPPATEASSVQGWLGEMRGSVVLPPGADLTQPVLEDVPDAELGVLHR